MQIQRLKGAEEQKLKQDVIGAVYVVGPIGCLRAWVAHGKPYYL